MAATIVITWRARSGSEMSHFAMMVVRILNVDIDMGTGTGMDVVMDMSIGVWCPLLYMHLLSSSCPLFF